MHGRLVRRGIAVALGGALLLGVGLAPLAQASGGGGCGRPVTDARGTTVAIRNFCFGPTILRTRPGQTVTWVNKDGAPHTVLGANAVWGGFDELRRGREVAYRFTRPGVYPYVCTYHIGMVGAVVVGNGRGPGAAHTMTTENGPVVHVFEPHGAAAVTPLDPEPARSDALAGAWPATVIAGSGLMIALAAFALRRRRLSASRLSRAESAV